MSRSGMARHFNSSFDETNAINILSGFLESKKTIKTEFTKNDKIPNIDGYFEILGNKNVPKKQFIVQIKKIENLQKCKEGKNKGKYVYDLETKFLYYVNEKVTESPAIYFVVDIKTKNKFWLYLSEETLHNIDFEGKQKVRYAFTDGDILDDIDEFTQTINTIVDERNDELNGNKKSHTFDKMLPINNLPYTRNPNFTGRDVIFKSITDTYEKSVRVALTQAISGLGGVGKTQIALEYAYRYGHTYKSIWWVNAENQAEIINSYSTIAKITGIINEEETNKEIIQRAVLNWFMNHTNWLLIFDNAENPESINEYMPKNNTGHILITSRYADWHRISKSIPVEEFKLPDAVSFLIKMTEIDDEKQAAELAKMLGRLPLALEQAAAYINNNKISFNEYIELFKEHGLQLFDEDGTKPLDYQSTVTVTWKISIEKIADESAKQLLYLCSFFAPENIDKCLFSENSDCFPDPLSKDVNDKLKYNRIITELAGYSLIKYESNLISIHRLLQEVIKSTLPKDVWLGYCTKIIVNAFSFDYNQPETWGTTSQIVPHALTIADQAYKEQVNLRETANIYNVAGQWLEHSAIYKDAEKAFNKAIKISEKVLGEDHTDTAMTYNNMAVVYKAQGDYEKALEYYHKALEIVEKVLEKEHHETATTYNNMAGVYQAQGDYKKALEYYLKALTIREKVLGKEHPDTAKTYNNMAVVYKDQGDYEKALEFYHKALTITVMVLGKEHPDTATTYNNMAGVYADLGDYEKALEFYNKALTISEKVLGKEHPSTGTTYNNMAVVYKTQGDYEKALDQYTKAYKIMVKTFNTDHVHSKIIKNNMKSAYISAGKPEDKFEEFITQIITDNK